MPCNSPRPSAPGGNAAKDALAAVVAYDAESNAAKAAAGKLTVPLEWVVDVADPNNDVDWYIGTAYAYVQDGKCRWPCGDACLGSRIRGGHFT